MANHLFVSVVIPVFNDTEYLKVCLVALSEQTYPKSSFEIIVIDNGSDDLAEVQLVVDLYKNAVFAHESMPGSYAARNKGLSLAKGEVIAFTDADCIPAPDWLENGARLLKSIDKCGLVAGQIKMLLKNPQKPTMVELYESVMGLPQQMFLEKYHYGATANLFTTKQVIEQVGNFNQKLKSSGDVEWGQRIHLQGYKQIYAIPVIVQHPTHDSFSDFFKRTKRLAGGHYDIRLQGAQSFWQRQAVFLQTLGGNLIPPVFFIINTLLDTRLRGIDQKLKVSSLMVLVRCISAWETFRLKFGGKSSRT